MSFLRRAKQGKSLDFSTFAHFGVYSIYPTKVPVQLSYLCFILSKCQTFAVSLLFSVNALESQQFLGKGILQFFIYLCLPGTRLNFSQANLETAGLFIIFQIYTYVSIFAAVYLFIQASGRKSSRAYIHKGWCNICYVHIWFLGFMITGYNMHIVKVFADGGGLMFGDTQVSRIIVLVMASIAIFWSITLNLMLCILFSHTLKTRDILSLKTKYVLAVDFIENSLLYGLELFLEHEKGLNWMFAVIGVIMSLMRLKLTYDYLAVYKLKFLILDISANTFQSCLNVFNFMTVILGKAEHKFAIIGFLLFMPLGMKLSWSHLRNLILRIILKSKGLNPYQIIHMNYLYKTFLDRRIPPSNDRSILNFEQLFFLGENNFYKILDSTETFSFDNPDHFKSFARSLLKYLIIQNKEHNILKISYVSQIYRYFDAYLEMIALIRDLRKNKISIGEEIDLLMVFKQVDSKLHKLARDKALESNLDMYKYIKVNEAYKKFKAQVIKQANLQMKFWDLYSHANTDFLSLIELSKEIEGQKLYVQRQWKKVEKMHEKNFTAAYLAYSLYLDIMNNRPSQSSAFIHHNSYILNKVQVESDELSNDTLYEKETSRIIVSASREDIGSIISCSRSIEEIVGYITEELVGTNIKELMPDFYREKHDGYLGNYFEYGVQTVMDKSRRVFALNSKGHLTPILLHVKLDPYIATQASFIGLMRPIRENSDYILVKSNGDIDAMTFGICENLSFDVRYNDYPMHKIWPDFRQLITYYNKFALHKIKKKKKDYYKIAIDDLTYDEMVQDDPKLLHRRKNSFLTGVEAISFLDPNISKDGISYNESRNSRSSLDSPPKMTGTMMSSMASISNLAWRKLKKMNKISNHEINKKVRYYSETGTEAYFKNVEKGTQIKCYIHVYTEIHDESWIIVIKIQDIYTEANDDSKNSSQLELELKQERIQREKKRTVVIQTQNEIHHRMTIGEDRPSSQTNGSIRKGTRPTLGELQDRPKTKTHLDEINPTSIEGSPLMRPKMRKARSSARSRKSIHDDTVDKKNFLEVIPTKEGGDPDDNTGSDMNASYNVMASDRNSENRDKLEQNYVLLPEKTTKSKNMPISSQSIKNYGNGKSLKEFKRLVTKTQHLLGMMKPKKDDKDDKEKNRSSFNREQGLANQILKKFVGQKDMLDKIDKQDTSSVGSVQTLTRVTITLENGVQASYREFKHIVFFWLYFFVITLINIIIILQTLYVRDFNLEIQAKNDVVKLTYLIADDMANLNWAFHHSYAVYLGLLGAYGPILYPQILEIMKSEVDMLVEQTKLLYANIQDQDLYVQNLYFGTEISINDIDSSGNIILGSYKLNPFDAADKALQSALQVVSAPYPTDKEAFELQKILINTLNEFQITSMDLIKKMEIDIAGNFSANRDDTNLYSIINFILLGSFFIGTLIMLHQINQSSFSFANLFLKLPKEDAEFSENQISKYIKALNEDFQNVDAIDYPEVDRKKAKKLTVKLKPKSDRVDIKFHRVYMANLFLMIRLWPILIILAFIVYVDTMNSINTTDAIAKIQKQVIQAAAFIFTSDMSVTGCVDMVLSNGTSFVMGEPVIKKVLELNEITSQVKLLSDIYQNDNRGFDEPVYSYLFGVTCEDPLFKIDFEKEMCNALQVDGKIGLLDVNLVMYKDIALFVEEFLESDRDMVAIVTFFLRQMDRISKISIFQNTYTTALLDDSQSRLIETINEDNELLITIAIIVSVVNVLLSMLAIPFVLLQLLNRDNILKKMFRLVPISVILKNRWLKFYLVRTSGKYSKSVERAI